MAEQPAVLEIDITAAHIAAAQRDSNHNDPLALALQERTGERVWTEVMGGGYPLRNGQAWLRNEERWTWDIDAATTQAIQNFDKGHDMLPRKAILTKQVS